MSDSWAKEMAAIGWRADFYARAAAWIAAGSLTGGHAQIRLRRVAAAASQMGYSETPEDAEPWLAVLATCPDEALAVALADDLESFFDCVARKWAGVPNRLAAAAHAAGLSPDEVRDRCWNEPGREVFESVMILATLAGYRLP